MPLKIIFMGTPEFAVPILKTIHDSKHEILAVYTQSPKKKNRGLKKFFSPVQSFAEKNELNVRSPEKINSEKELDYLKKSNPDVIIVVAYGKILPKKMLSIPNIHFINIHASLLPKWRGAAPIQRSLMNSEKETGISIMKIIEELDAGPIILQEKLKVEKEDNFLSLSKKLSLLGSKLIIDTLNILESGKYKFINQDSKKATYAKKILKSESQIDWSNPSNIIISKIKGLNPFPGTWFKHKNNRIKIIDASEINKNGKKGEVIDDNLTIACGNGALKVEKIQKEGKKILDTKSFLAGYQIKKGETLI